MESSYRKVHSSSKQGIIKSSDTSLRVLFVWGITTLIFIAQCINPTLAEDDDGTNNSNSISGKFFDYMNNLRSASSPNSSTNANTNANSTSMFRKIFIDSSSWQDAYTQFLEQIKKVKGMLSPNPSNNSTVADTLNISYSIYNSTQGLSSNRSARINGPTASWNWPWMNSAMIPTTTPRSRTGFNHIFFGPFRRDGDTSMDHSNPIMGSAFYPAPPPPGPGSSIFGKGSPSEHNFNYVYKYNSPNSSSELEQHTTTTIYIICICLIIMLVGTILFAFVSKCQENSRRSGGGSAPSSNTRGRRRRNPSTAVNSNSNVSTDPMSASPAISIIMPSNGDSEAPPAYPKVIFDPPPSYDSLYPGAKQ